jgi:SET domain-containing protein
MEGRTYRSVTWTDPRQEFRASATAGVGAFARAPIAAGEVVEIVGGTVMDERSFRRFQRDTPRLNAIQIAEDLHLVETPEVTARRGGGSLNHSCDSNLWMADEVTLVAPRAIAAGEELTVDYALFTAQEDWRLDQPCRCGSPLCRRTITGADWRLPEVQRRYYPHFTPFLNARIVVLRRGGAQPCSG